MGDEEVAAGLRELIAAVVVSPVDGRTEPKIEVKGKLAQLTGVPELFPQQIIPPTMVAGARYSRKGTANFGGFCLCRVARRTSLMTASSYDAKWRRSRTEKHLQRIQQRLRIVLALINRRRCGAALEQNIDRLPR
jgi:hypothetical protein